MDEDWPRDPAVCDLRALAQTLVTRISGCPPASCTVDGDAEKVECQGTATVAAGQACTRFNQIGDSCSLLCAPPSCTVSLGGVVHCSDGCSVDHITCFAVAEPSCPGSY